MSFEWSRYLTLAQELTDQAVKSSGQDTEARLRCAISRAYFAAFGEVQNHLRKEGNFIPNTARGHQIVVRLLKESADKTCQKMGQLLEDLRTSRNLADYDDVVPNLLALTNGALVLAETAISLLAKL